MSKEKNKLHESIAKNLVSELNGLGIKCYIWHVANTGSVYVRFDDNRMCSVRIGDHDGREKLKYKFNIRTDKGFTEKKWVKDDGKWRLYVPHTHWKDLIPNLQERFEQIKQWPESKYKYGIPAYKRKQDIELTENYLKNG